MDLYIKLDNEGAIEGTSIEPKLNYYLYQNCPAEVLFYPDLYLFNKDTFLLKNDILFPEESLGKNIRIEIDNNQFSRIAIDPNLTDIYHFLISNPHKTISLGFVFWVNFENEFLPANELESVLSGAEAKIIHKTL